MTSREEAAELVHLPYLLDQTPRLLIIAQVCVASIREGLLIESSVY